MNYSPIDYNNGKRWFFATLVSFLIVFFFMFIFLKTDNKLKLSIAPLLLLGYVELPAPPKVIKKKKIIKPKTPPKVIKKIKEIPKPPPLAKAPVKESEPTPVPAEIVTAKEAPKPSPQIVENIKQLDNTDFNPIYNPKPRYPAIAREAGIEGYVVLELLINKKGRVESFSILKTFGHQRFGLEVAKVLKKWRFPPPMLNGLRTTVRYQYTIKFQLD